MFAVRSTVPKGGCPWRGDVDNGGCICSSHPVPWGITRAIEYVREFNEKYPSLDPLAVYRVSPKGRKQQKVYPVEEA